VRKTYSLNIKGRAIIFVCYPYLRGIFWDPSGPNFRQTTAENYILHEM